MSKKKDNADNVIDKEREEFIRTNCSGILGNVWIKDILDKYDADFQSLKNKFEGIDQEKQVESKRLRATVKKLEDDQDK